MSFFMRFVSFLMWRRLLALLTSFLLFAGLSFAIDDNLQNAQKDVKENIPISPNGSFGREKCDYSIKGKDSGILSARDFGAFPNDGKDDLPSIRSALAHAKKIGAKVLLFESGIYELHTPKGYTKELIFIDSMPNFSFLGAVSDKGEPKTVLRRVYEQQPHMELGSILRAYKSDNLTVKNIEFDNSPRFFANAEILENDGEEIVVKVFEDSPYIDGSYMFCGNLWDKSSKNLKNKPSVSYGGDIDADKENFKMRTFGNPSDRLIKLNNSKVASMCEVGEVLSWHFNWKSHSMCYFLDCDNLTVENVLITNGVAALIGVQVCENVYIKNVKFLSDSYSVGCRDGLHFAGCRGNIVIDGFVCEAVRWDGINVHGITVWAQKIIGPKTVLFSNDGGGCREWDFIPGDKMGFCFDREESVFLTIESAKSVKISDGRWGAEVTFKENIPEELDHTTVCNLYSLTADKVVVKKSVFKNIAGTAAIFRNDNVLVENCHFENIMYPAICFGAALAEHEGVLCKNEVVRNCVFKNCGWMPRHSAYGAIAARVQECRKVPRGTTPYMKNISIEGNKIYDCRVGLQLEGIDRLSVKNNYFLNVKMPIVGNDNINESIQGNVSE